MYYARWKNLLKKGKRIYVSCAGRKCRNPGIDPYSFRVYKNKALYPDLLPANFFLNADSNNTSR
jgi:hypothetical protein